MTLFLNKHIDNAQFEAHNCSTNAEDTFFFEIVYFIQASTTVVFFPPLPFPPDRETFPSVSSVLTTMMIKCLLIILNLTNYLFMRCITLSRRRTLQW